MKFKLIGLVSIFLFLICCKTGSESRRKSRSIQFGDYVFVLEEIDCRNSS